MNKLVRFSSAQTIPTLIISAGDSAQLRFLEFFTANIRNRNTRRAYAQAVREFLAWCEAHRVPSITAVQPMHVAGYIEELTRERSAPTAKQRLAAIRHLFDWLVIGQVMPVNPASSVRGPKGDFSIWHLHSLLQQTTLAVCPHQTHQAAAFAATRRAPIFAASSNAARMAPGFATPFPAIS
jgi:site-specific recombinase XerD